MSAIFKFVSARVVEQAQVCAKMIGGKDIAYADLILEVKLPADNNGVSKTSVVCIEVWGKLVQRVATLQPGTLVSAGGVVFGRAYVNKYNKQGYMNKLRLREFVVEQAVPPASEELEDDIPF